MTITYRRTIFYALVLLFFVLGGGFVAYSQGFRFDFATFRITKVGALYIHSKPTTARIYLNNTEIKNQSWLLQNGTFINNLFPQKYRVALSANGYKDWHRTVTVAPSLVTEIANALLIPVRSQSVPVQTTKKISQFAVGTAGISVQTTDNTVTYASTTIPASLLLGTNNSGSGILVYKQKLGTFTWISTDKNISYSIPAPAQTPKEITQKNSPLLVDPYEENSILLRQPQRIVLSNPQTNEKRLLAVTTQQITIVPESIAFGKNVIVWSAYDSVKKTSSIFVYNKLLGTTTLLSPELAGRTKSLYPVSASTIGVLQDSQIAYVVTLNTNTAEIIGKGVRALTFSPNGENVVLKLADRISVVSFTDETKSYSFQVNRSGNINALLWHKDSAHIFVVYDTNEIYVLDITDHTSQNFDEIGTLSNAFYDQETNALYGIDAGSLVSFQFP